MTTEPTDAELKAMWQLHAADIGGIFYYARAVLAKWGAPAPAQDDSLTAAYMAGAHDAEKAAAAELRRQHAEIETLRAGYAAARLEIESLRERVQELGKAARDVNSRRVQELEAQIAAVAAPKKWAPEEVADGGRGIRWVTNEGVHGRPTDHDVREYLKRTPTANGCHCDDCKRFYAAASDVTAAPAQAGEYPELPIRYATYDAWGNQTKHGYNAKDMHAYVDADRAARGATQASPVDANVQAAVPADLMTFTSSTQPALQQAHHEEQPDGTTIPIDPSEMAPQQPAPAPMSPANRLVAYSAATRLRELGFEWDATAEAWLQPAPSAQAADSVLEDAARYRWLREGNDAKHGAAWYVAVNLYGCEWDAAIDAAMNKGGAT